MNGFAKFLMPQSVFYGRNSLTKLGEQGALLGKKALLVSDRVMEKIGHLKRSENYLEECGVSCATYLDVNSEPVDVHVSEALEVLFRNQCDLVIAIGGGSCIDVAKAVSVLAANGGYIGEYMGGKKAIEKEPLPLIAIPTTAGTGSEVTDVTVITSTKSDIKMMIKHPKFIPTIAIVDPILTMSSPPHVTAATGIDAICHAIEAYISKRAQPLTDMFALSAIEFIMKNIRTVYENGEDLDAREKMALASMQAGVAFSNSSVTLVHGMSRPIGALFHVPHGVSNAMLLPAVLEYTKESAVDKLAVIGEIIDPSLKGLSNQEIADAAIREMKKLCKDLKIPNMKTWGIDKAHFERVVSKMAEDAIASGSPGNNPKVPSHQEIVELYYRCYDFEY